MRVEPKSAKKQKPKLEGVTITLTPTEAHYIAEYGEARGSSTLVDLVNRVKDIIEDHAEVVI